MKRIVGRQDVDTVLVDVLEDDVVSGGVVDVVEEVVLVELVVVGVELVAEVELVVGDDEVKDVIVVRLEELEGLELEAVRAKYAPMPATAMIITTIAAMAARAIPPLLCGKEKCTRATLFNAPRPFPDMRITRPL